MDSVSRREDRKLFWLFSGVEFTYWLAYSVGGYLIVFLQESGMNGTQQGVLNALMAAVAIFGAPILGAVSDRIRSERKVLFLCLLVSVVVWLFIPWSSRTMLGSVPLVMLLASLCNFFKSPATTVKDSWVVAEANAKGLNYGAIRLWGSIGYAIISIALSWILPRTGTECTFYLYAAFSIPVLLLVLFGREERRADGEKPRQRFRDMDFGGLFRIYYYSVFLIFGFLFYVASNTATSFIPYLITALGDDSARVGFIYGYRAVLEVPMLLVSAGLRRRFPLQTLIPAAALLFAGDCILNSFASGLGVMIVNSTLTGLGSGIFIATATNYIYRLAPEELRATAQMVFAATSSVAGIVGFLLGGRLLDLLGARTFFLTAGLVLVGAAAFFVLSFLAGAKIFKKPVPKGILARF